MTDQFFEIFIPCVDKILGFFGCLLGICLLFVVFRLVRKIVKEIGR